MPGLDVEVMVTLDDGRQVLGVLDEWQQDADGGWVGQVVVYDGGSSYRDVVPAGRLERLVYCSWWRGVVGCREGCERQVTGT